MSAMFLEENPQKTREIILQHLGWLRAYMDVATSDNWHDMFLYTKRQIDWLESDMREAGVLTSRMEVGNDA